MHIFFRLRVNVHVLNSYHYITYLILLHTQREIYIYSYTRECCSVCGRKHFLRMQYIFFIKYSFVKYQIFKKTNYSIIGRMYLQMYVFTFVSYILYEILFRNTIMYMFS